MLLRHLATTNSALPLSSACLMISPPASLSMSSECRPRRRVPVVLHRQSGFEVSVDEMLSVAIVEEWLCIGPVPHREMWVCARKRRATSLASSNRPSWARLAARMRDTEGLLLIPIVIPTSDANWAGLELSDYPGCAATTIIFVM